MTRPTEIDERWPIWVLGETVCLDCGAIHTSMRHMLANPNWLACFECSSRNTAFLDYGHAAMTVKDGREIAKRSAS